MKIFVKEIPQMDQFYSTIGDWWFGDKDRNINQFGDLHIVISEMNNPWYFWPVLFHELIEIAWCLYHGITSKMAEDFTKDYNAQSIQVLEGLEPVRKRPGMYIGSTVRGYFYTKVHRS
ncbi:MAG: hypothetical protein NTY64_04090 [Deltaproteobacteria bacterium]|nr:hypothetical protein [Deltaproteobacteria bacterium]